MISINYKLTGAGWSTCDVQINEHRVNVSASYLDDALGDFARAVRALLKGMDEARFSFAEEPGEYRWILRPNSDHLHCRILWFDALWSNRPDAVGAVILDAHCNFRDFVSATLVMLNQVLLEHGEEGYLEKWIQHAYPMKELREIEVLFQPI